jgi:hypothetical protein
MAGTGTPNVSIQVEDASLISIAKEIGVCAVLGITEMGIPTQPKLIRNWAEYRRNFGGLMATSDFPLYCKMALDGGSSLLVSRLVHYADITDPSTAAGVKSIVALIWGTPSPTGGLEIEAKSVGAWGNGLSVEITPSGVNVGKFIVKISFSGNSELTRSFELSETPTQAEIDGFNETCETCTILSTFGNIEAQVSTPFTTGIDDYTGLVLADYVGDSFAKTGLHSFDENRTPVRIAIPENVDSAINDALVSYITDPAVGRMDMRPIVRMPIGISGYDAVDYRNGTGLYTGANVIDTWVASIVWGSGKIRDPYTGLKKSVSPIGYYIGAKGKRDNKSYPWRSVCESNNLNHNKVPYLELDYNIGLPSRITESDSVNNNGINSVIGIGGSFLFSGDWTMQKAQTRLRDDNVADLVMHVIRGCDDVFRPFLYKPQHPITWKAENAALTTFLEDIKSNQGIDDYRIVDDSKASTKMEATVNTLSDLDAGIYRVFIYIKPVNTQKYILVQVTINNSSTSYEVIPE